MLKLVVITSSPQMVMIVVRVSVVIEGGDLAGALYCPRPGCLALVCRRPAERVLRNTKRKSDELHARLKHFKRFVNQSIFFCVTPVYP